VAVGGVFRSGMLQSYYPEACTGPDCPPTFGIRQLVECRMETHTKDWLQTSSETESVMCCYFEDLCSFE